MNAEYYLIFMLCCARRAWGLLREELSGFQVSNMAIHIDIIYHTSLV